MANTLRVPRTHLILALCLPLAVLIGYFLAEPLDPGGLTVVLVVLGILSVPLFMKYHHLLLVVGWNACISFAFVRGAPYLWMVMAGISLGIAVVNRAINPDKTFLSVPMVLLPLALLTLVIAGTAFLTGGIGLQMLGSSQFGGRCYLEIFGAVAGYLAFTSERIPLERANLYVGLFFLSGLTALLGNIVFAAGPEYHFLYGIFPFYTAVGQAAAESSIWHTMPRLGGLQIASTSLFAFLLARHGVRGVFDYSRPWRQGLFILAAVGCLLSGFRGLLILFVLTFLAAFILEGLWRTRALPILVATTLVSMAVVLPQTDKLYPPIQRALSFLPVKVDYDVRAEASYSAQWRKDMWASLIPEVPKYLVKGKGYTVDPNALYQADFAVRAGFVQPSEASKIAMDYHNGLLSILIPFGIFGLVGFLWFLGAVLRVLYLNYRFSNPALRTINTFLLAAVAAKTVYFFVVFGALRSDLWWYAGMLGLSISLNGGVSRRPSEAEDFALEEGQEALA